eukprot:2729302-Amphidinium_carterae.1
MALRDMLRGRLIAIYERTHRAGKRLIDLLETHERLCGLCDAWCLAQPQRSWCEFASLCIPLLLGMRDAQ